MSTVFLVHTMNLTQYHTGPVGCCRVPADAASQQHGADADDEWQQEESDGERPGETAKQRAARRKREEAAARKRQREALQEEKMQHRSVAAS